MIPNVWWAAAGSQGFLRDVCLINLFRRAIILIVRWGLGANYPRLVYDNCWGSRITFCAPVLADGWHLRGSGRGRPLLMN